MAASSNIPHTGLDSTLALMSEGYTFVSDRCRRLQSDVFRTRLLLRPLICMQGEEAAQLFYDNDRFRRTGAAPTRVKKTLFGQGGVQGLDGSSHRRRKQLFMSLLTGDSIEHLGDLVSEEWQRSLQRWERKETVVLFDEVRELLCRAVCRWTGVPLQESEAEQRTADLGMMIDGTGAIGPRHWQGRWARSRAEAWIGDLVDQVRNHELEPEDDSALHNVSWHRDTEGDLLDRRVAAVELLNILRPTIDVARYVVFGAHALHRLPEWQHQLRTGDEEDLELFVQEVRRFYPFFPFAAARVRTSFSWKGYRFPEGWRTILDLYGTNHDARSWDDPDTFRPERFREWDENAYDFIPQGGGDPSTGHRCPGEWITIALMKRALRLLTESMSYEVPNQDLRMPLSQMPALPNSGFVISHVHPESN